MRLLEAVLTAALLLTVVVWVLPALRGRPRIRRLTAVTGLVALLQIGVEGVRWQLLPAYLLAAALLTVWLISIPRVSNALGSGPLQVPPRVRGLGVGCAVLTLVIAVVLPVALPVFRFDQPTGRHAVGTSTYHWVDDTRPELFTAAAPDQRELMARVWYPVDPENDAAARGSYLRHADTVTPWLAHAFGFPDLLFGHFSRVTTNAVPDAALSDRQRQYPVLLFLTGLNGFAESNTFQIQELVSRGFVVVALDQPGVTAATSLPDGRVISGPSRARMERLLEQSLRPKTRAPSLHGTRLPRGIVPYLAQDVSFALDQLRTLNRNDPERTMTGRLDLDRVGIFGVSLGGMTGAHACANDERLRACLIMDVELTRDTLTKGLQQPSMFLTRDGDTMRMERRRAGGWNEQEIAATLGSMRSGFADSPEDSYLVSIEGMFHSNFTDAPRWSPLMSRFGLSGPIPRERGFDIVNRYTVAFFEHYLEQQPAPLLTGADDGYPEVEFRRSVDK